LFPALASGRFFSHSEINNERKTLHHAIVSSHKEIALSVETQSMLRNSEQRNTSFPDLALERYSRKGRVSLIRTLSLSIPLGPLNAYCSATAYIVWNYHIRKCLFIE